MVIFYKILHFYNYIFSINCNKKRHYIYYFYDNMYITRIMYKNNKKNIDYFFERRYNNDENLFSGFERNDMHDSI